MRYGMHVYNNYTHIQEKWRKQVLFVSSVHLLKFFSTKCKKKQYVAIYTQKCKQMQKNLSVNVHKECEKKRNAIVCYTIDN